MYGKCVRIATTKGKQRGQPDPVPTSALPGSPEKVEVLIRRARLGYSLFHPDDAVCEPDLDLDLPLYMLASRAG